MPLCTQADVQKVLQLTFTNPSDPTIAYYIGVGSAVVEAFCNQTFATVTAHAETHDGPDDSPAITLDHTPVTSITSIVEDGVALTATQYIWYANGLVVRMSGDWPISWTSKLQAIVVTYAGGQTAPTLVAYVAAAVAARAFRAGYAMAENPNPVMTLERIGDYMAQWKGTPELTALTLTVEEKRLLRPWQRTVIAGGL